MTKIRDGSGAGYYAAVTSTNRLSTVAEVQSGFAVISGETAGAFSATTGVSISVPTVTESAVLFVENQSSAPLVLAAFAVGNADGGIWRAYFGATGITGGTPVTLSPSNLNLTSGRTFGGVAQRGDAAGTTTVTGGTVGYLGFTEAGFTNLVLEGALILGFGNTLALSFENPTGAAVNVQANLLLAFGQTT